MLPINIKRFPFFVRKTTFIAAVYYWYLYSIFAQSIAYRESHMILGINHIAISTSDFQRALSFYRDVIGMSVDSQGHIEGELCDKVTALKNMRSKVALLTLGNCQIELFEFSSPEPQKADPLQPVCDHGITHICFDVDDIEKEYQRLLQAGVNFHCPPQDFGNAKATYARDPDGNVFELVEAKVL